MGTSFRFHLGKQTSLPWRRHQVQNGRTQKGSWKECFHSCDQWACFATKTKENVCIRIELNSRRISWRHQHGRRSFVSGHQHGRHDVTWKHSIVAQNLEEGIPLSRPSKKETKRKANTPEKLTEVEWQRSSAIILISNRDPESLLPTIRISVSD